jgi:hypothetical protein
MRRIIGFFGLVLIFTNCVTLFHSARVLEPGEFETGGSFTLAGMATQEYADYYKKSYIEYTPLTTPPIGLFIRNGWNNGVNTGAYLGLPFIDFFVTKLISRESENHPSTALTVDFSLTSLLFYNEYAAAASLDLFKSRYDNNDNINPFIKIRAGFKAWNSADILSGSTYSGTLQVLGLVIGNEMKITATSYMIVSASFEGMYGGKSWGEGPYSFELNLNFTLSRRYKKS